MAPPVDDALPQNNAWTLLTRYSPERLSFALRLALICALVALVAEIYKTPEIALTTYVVFFLNKPDRVESIVLSIAFTIIITVIVGFLLVIASPVLASIPLRVGAMAAISFTLLFLVSASKLKPIGSTLTLIIAYALDLLGSVPLGELVTRAFLYTLLFVAIPAAVSIVINLLFGAAPRSLAQKDFAARLCTAAKALQTDEESIRELKQLLAEGDEETQKELKLSSIEHSSRPEDLDALKASSDGVVTILSAVQLMVTEPDALPSTETRSAMQSTLLQMAAIFEKGGYPALVEPIPVEGGSADLVCSSIMFFNAGLSQFGERRPSSKEKKAKSGFFLPNAFSNPEHVQYAFKTTLAAMTCYLIYSVLNWPGIHTALITCFIVSLGTVAESVEKLRLRILGCMVGTVAGLGVMIGIIPRTTDIGHLMVVVFAGAFIGAWIAAGSPRISYAGLQFAFAYFLCAIQGSSPAFNMVVARDRVIGIFLGILVSYFISTRLWPASIAPHIDEGLKTAQKQLQEIYQLSNPWQRRRVAAETQALLHKIETDIQLAGYEPPSIRPTTAWRRARRNAVRAAQRLDIALFARSELKDSGKEPAADNAALSELSDARSHSFQLALSRIDQSEEHA
ncbi:FUSC family protein [Edaphobacter modestus]|uniref:Multidrug resistance protein MdtO n=1 Tax=Edaphobacter modestus TaxID=388466 RepID=A0A4V2G4Q3_9BACT|nr:FUSC family protein [Edaphobacter modestus]RZU41896.1 multidrug resistance protein MdtO [Edaphobacter modestus]